MINKKSYNSGETSSVTGPSNDLVMGESSTETGARGFNLSEMTHEYSATDPEPMEYNELIELLIDLGDNLDASEEETLANFADFLIKKFAEAKNQNTTILFNNLLLKINNADIPNTNEILKKITNIYSKTLLLEYIKNDDLDKSKDLAYKKALHRAGQYLSEV